MKYYTNRCKISDYTAHQNSVKFSWTQLLWRKFLTSAKKSMMFKKKTTMKERRQHFHLTHLETFKGIWKTFICWACSHVSVSVWTVAARFDKRSFGTLGSWMFSRRLKKKGLHLVNFSPRHLSKLSIQRNFLAQQFTHSHTLTFMMKLDSGPA